MKPKLTTAQRNAVARAYKRGEPVVAIAEEFKVSPANVINLARARKIPIRRQTMRPYANWLRLLARYYGKELPVRGSLQ